MPAHLRAALTQTHLSIPVDGGGWRSARGRASICSSIAASRSPREIALAPDRRMSARMRVRAWLAQHAPDLRADRGRTTAPRPSPRPRRRSGSSRRGSPRADRPRRRATLPAGHARRCPARQCARARRSSAPGRACSAPEETLALTGHPVGGVCPFGLATALPVYLDVSLKAFDIVYPAGGIAQLVGRGDAGPAVRAGRRALGRPMPPARGSGRDLGLPARRLGIGQGVPAIRRSTIAAMAGRGLEPEAALPGEPEEAVGTADRSRRRGGGRARRSAAPPSGCGCGCTFDRRPLLHRGARRARPHIRRAGRRTDRSAPRPSARRTAGRLSARNRARRRPSWRTAGRRRRRPAGASKVMIVRRKRLQPDRRRRRPDRRSRPPRRRRH